MYLGEMDLESAKRAMITTIPGAVTMAKGKTGEIKSTIYENALAKFAEAARVVQPSNVRAEWWKGQTALKARYIIQNETDSLAIATVTKLLETLYDSSTEQKTRDFIESQVKLEIPKIVEAQEFEEQVTIKSPEVLTKSADVLRKETQQAEFLERARKKVEQIKEEQAAMPQPEPLTPITVIENGQRVMKWLKGDALEQAKAENAHREALEEKDKEFEAERTALLLEKAAERKAIIAANKAYAAELQAENATTINEVIAARKAEAEAVEAMEEVQTAAQEAIKAAQIAQQFAPFEQSYGPGINTMFQQPESFAPVVPEEVELTQIRRESLKIEKTIALLGIAALVLPFILKRR